MLILAGVTITTSYNSVVKNASKAGDLTEYQKILEMLKIRKSELQMKNAENGKNGTTVEEFDQYIIDKGVGDYNITRNNIVEMALRSQIEISGYVYDVTQITDKTIVIEYRDLAMNFPMASIETEATTNSITVTKLELIRADNGTYSISYKKRGESEYKNRLEGNVNDLKAVDDVINYKMENLKADIYEIKVEVTNESGKSATYVYAEKTKDFTLGGMLTLGDPEWDSSVGTAKVKLSVGTEYPYTIEYKIIESSKTSEEIIEELGKGWTPGGKETYAQGIRSGDRVFARLSDGINVTEYTMIEVIDTILPTVTLEATSISSNVITIEATATDGESGILENTMYKFSISEDGVNYREEQNTTSNVVTIMDLVQLKKYYIKVEEVEDRARNKNEETVLEVQTIELKSDGNIKFDITSWDTDTRTATVEMSTETGYNIEYQVENVVAGGWIPGTSVSEIEHGQTVFARLINDKNVSSDYASALIKDIIPPESFTITGITGLTATGLTINETTTVDNQTGFANIEYYVGTNTVQETATLLTSLDVTGLSEGTVRYIWAVAVDNVGNTRKSTNYYTIQTPHTHTGGCYSVSRSRYSIYKSRKL